jgi:uncharacterized protein YbjT (DUF2867 family)
VILLTGATGYIGGRLLPLLEASGRSVRCLARRPEYLLPKVAPTTEVVRGDVLDRPSLDAAMRGVDVAYYLVHSMGSAGGFQSQDHEAARNFGEAARAAGVRKLIYLGGLGHGPDLSEHLRSRQEVGEVLRASGVPTVEFRASIIIGSGSLSFEMIRSLVEKLPVMVMPRWVNTLTQPISVEDVLAYLMQGLDCDTRESVLYEIGGADRVSYVDIMREYARQRGLKRYMLRLPILTPWLSSLWLGLVTPLYARVGRKLIDGVRNETVVEDERAANEFDIRPRGMAESVERALVYEDRRFAATRWSDALSSTGPVHRWAGGNTGRRIVDSRTEQVPCSAAQAFRPIARIGGETGWYSANFLWRVRGFLDRLVGGPGLRRGRRHPEELRVGDALDFWRVEEFGPPGILRLAAEMKMPGRAWLQFEVEDRDGRALIRQTVIFDPSGLLGLAYWYVLYPLHAIVFRGMLRQIAREACARNLPRPRHTKNYEA